MCRPVPSEVEFDVLKAVDEAMLYLQCFKADMQITAAGLHVLRPEKWALQAVRRQGVVQATLDKIGSNAFVKRRPENIDSYSHYVARQYASQQPLQFRVPVGPLKNMICCGDYQVPDIAEYLMFVQLARFASAVAQIYPYGVKVQVVPDDVRARAANQCPDRYVRSYVSSMRLMIELLGLSGWLQAEDGQTRLCDLYKVHHYQQQAEQSLRHWRHQDPEAFAERWQSAQDNARKNYPLPAGLEDHYRETAIADSAWRYMLAHQCEILSGMWSTQDAFPMVYANHRNNYQLFSMGQKRTKLPWQLALPADMLVGHQPHLVRSLFNPVMMHADSFS